jgi:VanZ family protein
MSSRFAAALIAFTLLLAFPSAGASQQSAVSPPDTTVRASAIPSVESARAAISAPRARARNKLPIVFYGMLATGAVTAAVLHVDPDTGGYHDGWNTATDFPDKAVHALAAWAITNVGVDLGARPRYAAIAVCAAGTAFEFAQGYVSVYDVAADCAGAAGAGAWQSWRARRKARAARKASTSTTAAAASR